MPSSLAPVSLLSSTIYVGNRIHAQNLNWGVALTIPPTAIYFQAIQGVSAVQAGIKILPLLLATVVSSVVSGILISVFGYYNAIILPSTVLYCIGAGLITTFAVDTPLGEWFGYQVLCGLGIGAGFQIPSLVVQTVLPQDQVPVGTAVLQFFQTFGGAIFVSVAQTLFQNGLLESLSEDNIGLDGHIFINSGASEVRGILAQMGRSDALDAVLRAYMKGLTHTFYITVSCACLAFVSLLGLEWRSVKKGPNAAPKEENTKAADSQSV